MQKSPFLSARLPLAFAAALALTAFAPPAPSAEVRLPALGESAAADLSVGDEHRLGEEVMYEIRRDPDYLDDPLLLDYVETVWQPLVAASRERGNITPDIDTLFAWEPFLIRDRVINAFALPGGYVGVYLGLLAITDTRDQLAAVLSHEMSHITQRHIARSMINASHQSLLGMAAIILGAIAAGRSGNGDATEAVLVTGQAALAQGQINFTRDMEREADRVGYGVLTTAGFSPQGVPAMFEKLQAASRLEDTDSFPYLRDHPLTIERIGDARSRSLLGPQKPQSRPLEHVLMQARARVLMDPRIQSLRRQQAGDGDMPGQPVADRIGNLYASALASILLRDWPRADAAINQGLGRIHADANDDARGERDFQFLRAQLLVARGEPTQALALYDAMPPDPSRAMVMGRAEAAVAAGAAHVADASATLKRSAEALQTWLAVHPKDGGAWSELGRVCDQMKLPLRALRAEAEARATVGDFSGAIDRLRAGRQMARHASDADFIDASILESRLRDLLRQRRALLAEMRGERHVPGDDSGGDDDSRD
jgi:predicted Zn-dependent protease